MATIQKKKSRLFFAWLWFLAPVIILLVVGGWMLKPESEEAKNLTARLQTTVIEELGEKSNMDKERIAKITVSRVSAGWNAEITLNADKGFTMVSTKQSMWQQAIAILKPLSELQELNDISISWVYPVVGPNDRVTDQSVMSFRLDRTTRNQLIWENVEPSLLPDIAFDYKENSVLNE
ncbi:hypothetical protein [Planococcus beijingensis]|uniref:hypothetical protein n=1 Tax=Planococcus beijingensis TaxID=2782551 RepID=UPI00193C6D68|nr:hypothetical protein [Planococcus beijingensis]